MPIRVGAHVSIAGTLDRAIDRAQAIGADCIQVFGSAPQQWQHFIFPLDQVALFNRKREEAGIEPVFLHSIYLINLASENHFILGNSIASLVQYLKFGKFIGAEGVVFHVGSHNRRKADIARSDGTSGRPKGKGFLETVGQVTEAITQILSRTEDCGNLIIENSAGAGGLIGAKFAEIGSLAKAVNSPRVAVCLDTAHAFESGCDLRTKAGLARTLEDFDREIGLEKLAVIHANDSKTPLGSNRDRHENIGEGEIGLKGFREIVNHPVLRDLPFILETPGFDQNGPDLKNIEALRNLTTGYQL